MADRVPVPRYARAAVVPETLIADKYRLRRLIGEGAMGVVWAAVNERTEREVALKLINGENENLRRRLLREARACGRLVHRNIIEIYDVGETREGEPFLVMPLLSGETLAERLKRDGLLAPPLAARIACDVARGLAAAHQAGIIHRDLKPANVFLHHELGSEDDFVVKVLDFGVSKIVAAAAAGDTAATLAGGAVGSPLYMSPEQALGDAGVGPRSDLWAVGVLLFEMLTGTRPFYGATAFAVVAQILRGPIPTVLERAPGVDPRLGAVVARCLVRRPDKRIGSATELAALLEPFAGAREHGVPSAPLPEVALDEDEETSFFRKPPRASGASAEMLAAAEMLASAGVLATGDILSSADVVAVAPLDGTAPLPLMQPKAAEPPPSARDPMASSTMPLVHPADVAPMEADETDADLVARMAGPRRTTLWVGLSLVVAAVLLGGLYLSAGPSKSPASVASAHPVVPAASGPRSPPPTPTPTPTPAATTEPIAAPAAATASVAAPAEPADPVPGTATRPRSPGASHLPAPAGPKGGGKIIRENPF
jgi:serine/threonine protein kinase